MLSLNSKTVLVMRMPMMHEEAISHILAECSYCHWPYPAIEVRLSDPENEPVGTREIFNKPEAPYVLSGHVTFGVTCPGSGEEPADSSKNLS